MSQSKKPETSLKSTINISPRCDYGSCTTLDPATGSTITIQVPRFSLDIAVSSCHHPKPSANPSCEEQIKINRKWADVIKDAIGESVVSDFRERCQNLLETESADTAPRSTVQKLLLELHGSATKAIVLLPHSEVAMLTRTFHFEGVSQPRYSRDIDLTSDVRFLGTQQLGSITFSPLAIELEYQCTKPQEIHTAPYLPHLHKGGSILKFPCELIGQTSRRQMWPLIHF